MFSGSKVGSPDTSGVTRRQSRVCFVDCKGILTPILRIWVQKSTLLLRNRGHAEVLKKTPSSAKYVTKVRPPLYLSAPPPPPGLDLTYSMAWHIIMICNICVITNHYFRNYFREICSSSAVDALQI